MSREQVRILAGVLCCWLLLSAFLVALLWEDATAPPLPQPPETVSSFGLDLRSIGVPLQIPKITYLHVLHLFLMVILSGQLFVAWLRIREAYLAYVLTAALLLSLYYTLLLFVGLSGASLPAQSTLLPWILSISSSLALFLSSLAARRSTETFSTRSKLASCLVILFFLSGALFLVNRLGRADVMLSSIPIGSFSFTVCAFCGLVFYKRARAQPRTLRAALLISFCLYALVHLFEPLVHAQRASYEAVFLASFVAKPIAFLSIVALALVETHSSVLAANSKLTDFIRQIEHEQRVFRDLLRTTMHAFFRDRPDGQVLVSEGEEEIVGFRVKDRQSVFDSAEEFRRFIAAVARDGFVRELRCKWRNAARETRYIELSARLHDGLVEGFYHDVSRRGYADEADRFLEEINERASHDASPATAATRLCKAISQELAVDAAFYFMVPWSAGQRQFCLFAASEPRCDSIKWPTYVAPEKIDFSDARSSSEFSPSELLELIPFNTRPAILGRSREASPSVLGFCALFLPASAVNDRHTIFVERLRKRIETLVLTIDVSSLRQQSEDGYLLSSGLTSAVDFEQALRQTLSAIAAKSSYRSLAVLLDLGRPKDDRELASKKLPRVGEAPLLISSLPPGISSPPSSFDEFSERHFNSVLKGRSICELSSAHKLLIYAVPIRHGDNSGQLAVGCLVAERPSSCPFSILDAEHIESLAEHIAIIYSQQKADIAFRRTVSKITHDIRAPIAAIRNSTRRLQRHWEPLSVERRAAKLADIIANADDLTKLAEEADLVRERRELEKPVITKIFKDVIQKACKELQEEFRRNGAPAPIALESDFIHIPPLLLPRTAVDRIVQNILTNTAKYGTDWAVGRRPRILGRVEDDYFVVLFRNWGDPIRSDEAERIFRDGYQGTPHRGISGRGMGLSIARELARKQLQGNLLLTSEADPVEFSLYIPRSAEPEEEKRDGRSRPGLLP